MNIGIVSIIVRRHIGDWALPESRALAEKYPELVEKFSPPICYFDIDRIGAYAKQELDQGKTPAQIGLNYFRDSERALKEFAKYARSHPESEFAQAKYIVEVSRLGSEAIGLRLGFDVFTDVNQDETHTHHSTEMAAEFFLTSGMTPEEASKRSRKHGVSVAVMPMTVLLERY